MKTRIESKEEHLKAPCYYELLDVLCFKEEIIEADDYISQYRYKYIELFPESETCDLTLISEKGSGYVHLMPYDDVVRFSSLSEVVAFYEATTGLRMEIDFEALARLYQGISMKRG